MKKSIQKYITVALLFICISFTVAESPVKITVTADHADWVYQLKERVKFKVFVTQNGALLNNVKISYEVGAEKMIPTLKSSVNLGNGQLEIDGGTMTSPGFLRCTVRAEIENKNYRGMATVAYNPEKIESTTTVPTDFLQFWDKAKADNVKIPLDAQMTLLPNKCTEKVNVYQINVQNCKIGMRVYGILCVPKALGKYPALLCLPGSGVKPYYTGIVDKAEKGMITLVIGIHGIPVTLDSIVYANLDRGALAEYQTFNLDNKDAYYFKHVYLGCVRAIDFITTLPEYDGHNLIVSGGSQGGALAIVTAALDKRVICLSSFYPALCDVTGYQFGRAGGWPLVFNKPELATKENLETLRYYDVVNFAKQLTVPGFYAFGFNDVYCPPTSIYAAYNSISAPKTLVIAKEMGHSLSAEQKNKSNEFLYKQLNVK